jgi:hypothetical protein
VRGVVAVQDALADGLAERARGFLERVAGGGRVLALHGGSYRSDQIPHTRLDGVITYASLFALPVPL